MVASRGTATLGSTALADGEAMSAEPDGCGGVAIWRVSVGYAEPLARVAALRRPFESQAASVRAATSTHAWEHQAPDLDEGANRDVDEGPAGASVRGSRACIARILRRTHRNQDRAAFIRRLGSGLLAFVHMRFLTRARASSRRGKSDRWEYRAAGSADRTARLAAHAGVLLALASTAGCGSSGHGAALDDDAAVTDATTGDDADSGTPHDAGSTTDAAGSDADAGTESGGSDASSSEAAADATDEVSSPTDAAATETADAGPIFSLRAIHLSADAGGIKLCIKPKAASSYGGPGALGLPGLLPYKSLTGYAPVSVGDYTVAFIAGAASDCSAPLAEVDVVGLATGDHATLALVGRAADGASGTKPLRGVLYRDDAAAIDSSGVTLRFVHAATATPSDAMSAVDLTIVPKGGSAFVAWSNTTYGAVGAPTSTLSGADANGFASFAGGLPAGTTFSMSPAGASAPAWKSAGLLGATGVGVFTLWSIGSAAGDPTAPLTLLLTVDNGPTIGGAMPGLAFPLSP